MLVGMVGVLSACGGNEGDSTPHSHSFDTSKWESDSTNHWNPSTCGHSDEKGSVAKHTFNGTTACTVCGYTCEHTFESTWTQGATTHYKKATCGHTEVKGSETEHSFNENKVCEDCGLDAENHTQHIYDEWSYDSALHWKECIFGCEDADILEEDYHSISNGVCSTCGYTTVPKYDPEAKYDEYTWNTTELVAAFNENSNNQQLSSELRRYLAGDLSKIGGKAERIDGLVKDRNEAALKNTKVTIKYQYWDEGDNQNGTYGWKSSIKTMTELVLANADGSPDIYCNQIYDMVAASLNGCFANTRSIIMGDDDESDDIPGKNYFSFTDQEFIDYANATGNEYGYMMEYMSELGFSVKKQYLIASDYFIDLVRAFFVIPLNNYLLTTLDIASTSGDRDKDGEFTVADFYDMVTHGEWTYDMLVKYSEAIYDGDMGTASGSLDNLNGFVLANNGLVSTGVLYTTSVKLFSRSEPDEDGFFRCTYPTTNEDLFDFCDALSEMVKSHGVFVAGSGVTLLDVREKFVNNRILFGGIILLGSLEYSAYQGMYEQKGFGILPVPVFREGDAYLTMIHNMGRIAAIAMNTTEFIQATAFLDYQSTHSTDILNQYYDYKLQYQVAGNDAGNTAILQYIRKNVRSAFEMTYENVTGYYFGDIDEQSSTTSWAGLIRTSGYSYTKIRGDYVTNADLRGRYLEQILDAYKGLPE